MTSESIEITLSGDTVTLEKDVVNTIEVTAGTAELEAVESNTVSVVATNAATVEVYDPSIGFTYGSNPNNPFNDEECTVELLNLHGVAGLTWVQLAWIEDAPSAFSHTEVWRSTTVNLFSAAQLIGTTQDTTYTDNVDPDTEYHYWVRPVAYSGKVGQFTGPFGIEANSNKRNFAHAIQDYIDIDRLTLPIITGIEELIAASVDSEAALRDSAITKEVDYFNTEMGGWLQQLEAVRLGYESETQRVEGLITEEKNVRAYEDEVLVERADLLSAEIVEEGRVRTAAIQEEEKARVLANSAMAERVRLAEVAITTEESERKAAILAEESARIGANDVTLGKVESLRGELNDEVGNRAASITEERNARIAQNEIVVEKVDLLDGSISTKFSEVEGLISAEESLRLTEDGVLLGQINTLRGDFEQEGLDVRGLIEEEARVRAEKDGVLVEQFDKLSGRFDGFSDSVDGVNDRIAIAEGQIVEANRIRAEETGALVESVNTLNATWDGVTVDDDGNPIYPAGSVEASMQSIRRTIVDSDLNAYTQYIDTLTATNEDGTDADTSLSALLQSTREAAVSDVSSYTEYIDTLSATFTETDDEGNPIYKDGSLEAFLNDTREAAVSDLSATVSAVDTLTAGETTEGSVAKQVSDAIVTSSNYADGVVESFKTDTYEVNREADYYSRRQGTNILDTSGWVPMSSIPDTFMSGQQEYKRLGASNESAFVLKEGPTGIQEVVFQSDYGSPNEPDGGFESPWFNAKGTDKYRLTAWVRSVNDAGYFKMKYYRNFSNSSGNSTMCAVDLPSDGKWYLVVAFIYPDGQGTGVTDPDEGGIFDPETGLRVDGRYEAFYGFDLPAGEGSIKVQLFGGMIANTNQKIDIARPRLEQITGAEPSIAELLYTPARNAKIEQTFGTVIDDIGDLAQVQTTLTAGVETEGSIAQITSTAQTAAQNYADGAVSAFKTDVFDVKVKAMDAARKQGSNKIDTSFWDDTFEINGNIEQTLADDSTVTWILNGATSENRFTTVTGPAGTLETVWRTDADNVSNADGGWVLDMPVDETKTYRSIVWVKRINGDGRFYLGCSTAKNATLLTNSTNPYYVSSWSGMTNNKWYMVVGILHKSSWGAPSGISGVYDPATGKKVVGGTDFIMNPGTETQRHRVYQYYQTEANPGIMYFARPRFEVMDGTEPTLYELMSTADRHATLTTTAEVVDGLKAEYSVKTDVNGHVAGFGLYNEGATSDFIVNASKFQVVHPDADSGAAFTVENGKTVIDGANIKSGVIGEFIKSAAFDGDLETTGGDTRGTTGWYIGSDGNAIFHNAYVRGTIDATSGSFSGDITGASGTFQGDLSGSTITGSKIYGTEIDGGFIRGAVIVSGTQLRNTDAGGDFFTYYDLQEYTSTKSFVKYYQGGKDRADVRYRLWTDNFMAYAYNALPNGAAYPNRYMNETVEFEFPETTINIYGRSTSEMRYTLQLQRADTGETLATIADLRTATSAWQNNSGIEVYHTGTRIEYDPDGGSNVYGYTKIRGTYSYTHSGEAMNYPLRWYVEIRTWRGIYGNGSGTVTINTTNESPVV